VRKNDGNVRMVSRLFRFNEGNGVIKIYLNSETAKMPALGTEGAALAGLGVQMQTKQPKQKRCAVCRE
jgi:hypothetical protein